MSENKDKSIIPFGSYCYEGNKICPYWSKDSTKHEQNNGFCSYLREGDWENDFYLLWDQVKECGENMQRKFLLIGKPDCKKCQTVKEFLYKNCIEFDYEDTNEFNISEYKYNSIPTLIVLDDTGEEIDRAVNKETSLIAKIKEYK
jgi:hypothetical protein